jgi:serine/threonine protein kinase/tetratricopeptide (TPR) repeat protein
MPDKWEDEKSLFEAALAQPPEAWPSFLAKSCPEPSLRDKVEKLLANYLEDPRFMSASSPNKDSLSESRPPLNAAGDVLAGRFRVVRFLSRGGMGEVYEAEDLELHEPVALKMIRPEIAVCYPNCLQRFKREVLLAKRVTHPNVCRIFDFFRHSDSPAKGAERGRELMFVSMELLRGETLSERLRRVGRINTDEALSLVSQITAALDAAHSVGVLHRDLKPGNIFLVATDSAKSARVVVTDFGLALSLEEYSESSLTPLTANEFLGTPAYMSPEQIQSRELTPASDIYSLGLVMYQMVTGVRPFEDETPIVMAANRLNKPVPSPCSVDPSVDRVWESVIVKCLDRDPQRRFQSAAQVSNALRGDGGGGKSGHKLRRNSIAILPFVNSSGDPEMEYLSDGITETIISTLSRIPKLHVMAHSTVFRFKGRLGDPQSIGRQLEVGSVLVGRVLHRGTMLNIGAELVDVGNGRQVWGEQYNRKFGDVFEVQEDIAQEISTNLELKLTSEEKKTLSKRHTQNTEAYQLYLKGRFCWNKRTEAELRAGIDFFTRAIECDHAYALAYAGLADSYTTQAFLWPYVPPSELMPRARQAAAKALSFDPTLAEGHASMGIIDLRYEWHPESAQQHFKRAVALKPSHAAAHQWYGECLAAMTSFDHAITELKLAQELDPLSLIINSVLGGVFCFARQYEKALEQCRNTLAMDSNYWLALFFLALSYEACGKSVEAIAPLQQALAGIHKNPMVIGALGHAYATAGRRPEAEQLLLELRALSNRGYTSPVNLALIALGLGDYELVFVELERALIAREGWFVFLRVDPRFDCVRTDPRFEDLIRRAGSLGSSSPTASFLH